MILSEKQSSIMFYVWSKSAYSFEFVFMNNFISYLTNYEVDDFNDFFAGDNNTIFLEMLYYAISLKKSRHCNI